MKEVEEMGWDIDNERVRNLISLLIVKIIKDYYELINQKAKDEIKKYADVGHEIIYLCDYLRTKLLFWNVLISQLNCKFGTYLTTYL